MHNETVKKAVKVNAARLQANLEELSHIGRNPSGGINRQFGSVADRQAREWLTDYWQTHLQLETRIDSAANMWIMANGAEQLRPLYMGSHIDTVPAGGMFDGALGVLIATELMETLRENKIVLRHPCGIVNFTGEEPNPFHLSTFGSKAIAGRLTPALLNGVECQEKLKDALAKVGGSLERIRSAQIKPGEIAAFLECHIEQGKRLDNAGLAVATVSSITGIYREIITVMGEANHAGTTMMRDRKDALLAASDIDLALEKVINEIGRDDVVATIGKIDAKPNAANIIPGQVTMTLDMRICSTEQKEQAISEFGKAVEKISHRRGVTIKREVNLDQPSSEMSKIVINAVNGGSKMAGEPATELVSMAGHDSVNMRRVTETGMLFVRSKNGKSHCPEEYTDRESIEKAAEVMLNALLLLDKEMN